MFTRRASRTRAVCAVWLRCGLQAKGEYRTVSGEREQPPAPERDARRGSIQRERISGDQSAHGQRRISKFSRPLCRTAARTHSRQTEARCFRTGIRPPDPTAGGPFQHRRCTEFSAKHPRRCCLREAPSDGRDFRHAARAGRIRTRPNPAPRFIDRVEITQLLCEAAAKANPSCLSTAYFDNSITAVFRNILIP